MHYIVFLFKHIYNDNNGPENKEIKATNVLFLSLALGHYTEGC